MSRAAANAVARTEVMNRVDPIAHRVATFLQKRGGAYCEACLVERLLVASRAAMKAALALNCFSVRMGVCPDCRTRKQVIAYRGKTETENVAA
jgi:hypothetical protein